jgi:Trypsin
MFGRREPDAARRRLALGTVGIAFLAVLAALLPSAAGAATAQSSVIGGHAGSLAEFPSIAFIQGEDAITPYACTGTVVAPRVVLTAGHCVEDLESGSITPPTGFAVATGITNLKEVTRANVSFVSQALVFPGFKPSKLQGDAGLLILTTPVTAPPVALASASDAGLLAAGTPLKIAGWGLTDFKTEKSPAQLQTGETVVQSASVCRAQSRRYLPFYSTAQQLCAIDRPSDKVSACFGDSGGPAIATRADVTSAVGPGCNPHVLNVFTRVDQVSDWVAAWIAAAELGAPAPAIKVPKAHAPFLSIERTEELAGVAFAEDFRQQFIEASEKRIACRRVDREKVKCGVAWFQGGDDYFGTVTIFYVVRQNTATWDDHYKIHWVNDRCYFHSGHRQSCVIRTRTS